MEPFHKILSYDEEHHSRHSVSAGKSDDIGNDFHTIWLFFTCKDRQFYAFPPLPNVKNGGENSFSPPFSFAVPIFHPIFAIGLQDDSSLSGRAHVRRSAFNAWAFFMPLVQPYSGCLLVRLNLPFGWSHHLVNQREVQPFLCLPASGVRWQVYKMMQYATTDNNQIRPRG